MVGNLIKTTILSKIFSITQRELVFFVDLPSIIQYVCFLLCSGYCACSETAYTAVSKVRLRTMADKGH